MLQAAAGLREETDGYIRGRIRAMPGGGAEISCRAGCFACCYHLVVVSPLEAHAIAAYVTGQPELAQGARGRLEQWRARLAEHPSLSARLEQFEEADGLVPDAEGGALEEEYWRAQLPCPFLEEGRCSIYPVRPFACREHAVTSDPALCALDLDAPTPAGTRMEVRAVAGWVGSACFGLPDRVLLLPRALEAAEARPEEAAHTAAEDEVRRATGDAQRRARLALARLSLAARPR